MNRIRLLLSACLLAACADASAFEADVHYGLTLWLALKAGFAPEAAKTIAIGDNRVDSGDMQYIDVAFIYACAARDNVGSARAEGHHYPSDVHAPAPPNDRTVVPGGKTALKTVSAAIDIAPDQAAYRLIKLGEALHALQDSWSHQGIPETPNVPDELFLCDETRSWGHPKDRGGWNSHKADLTRFWPTDTVAMAKATYGALTQYPPVSGAKRAPRDWGEIRPALDKFIAASTKTEKKHWFVSQGLDDVAFLEGISLKDGAERFELAWSGRKLPPLDSVQSRQHGVPATLLDFYNRFFARWVATTDFDAMAAEFGPGASSRDLKSGRVGPVATGQAELAARLKAWRLRDHGQVADIAHSPRALTARARSTVDSVAKMPNAYARYDVPADAFFPLLPRGDGASPLLPFFIWTPPGLAASNPRAVAVTKFRHLPYDALAVVAEQLDGRWTVISVVAAVDH